MTLTKLPKFEMYEEGGQIRRSSKSVKSTIVKGYGRRKYQQEYKRFLTYAIASNDESLDHLETLFDTGSLKEKSLYDDLHSRINTLGRKPNKVVNLAAQAGVRYSLENPYAYMDSNLVGFLNIIELCRHNDVEGLIYASSSSVYGGNEKIPFSVEDRAGLFIHFSRNKN